MAWSEAAWDELVSDLYRSAVDPAASVRLPQRLTALTGGAIASMWELRPQDCAVVGDVTSNVPDEAIIRYCDHFHRVDPWRPAVRQARFGAILEGHTIVDTATYERSSFYNEFAAEHDMFHMVGTILPLGHGPDATVGSVTILRAREAGPFEGDALRVLDRLLPHLHGAFRLRKQVGRREAAARQGAIEAVLEALGIPAVVVDGDGTVLHASVLALALGPVRVAMTCRSGSNRTLSMPAGAVRDTWRKLVAAAARGGPGGSCRLPGPPDLLLTVTPLPFAAGTAPEQAPGQAPGQALVTLEPLGDARIARDLAAYGLTAAEAAVANALAAGDSPAEIATARNVKISTVRTLLARAQSKMDARNLRDLVRLVLAHR